MGIFFASVVLSGLLIVAVARLMHRGKKYPGGYAGLGMFIGAFVGVILLNIYNDEVTVIQSESSRIAVLSLGEASEYSGRFVIGTGSIGSDDYYVFYQEDAEGFSKTKISSENVVVVEEDREDAALVKYDCDIEGFNLWIDLGLNGCTDKRPRLFVPDGTLIRDYDLNSD